MNPRSAALDAFRGAAVALMILVNNPGSWEHLFSPLDHAPWHGCTPTDLVFPFFLFAVGNALALVLPRLRAQGDAAFGRKLVQRTALIFLIGLTLNAAPFVRWDAAGELVMRDWGALRFMGVLQRIALCWGLAALLAWWLGTRGLWIAVAVLLLGYWAACLAWGQPGDPFSLQGWFGTAVDRALLGERHLYRGEGVPFDPEGLASTAPAVAQVLLGLLAGQLVTRMKPGPELVARLFVAAALALAGAYLWQLVFPLNKKIWTSSYVLHTTGLALATLALLIWWIEVRRRRGVWVDVLDVFGRNALFVFALSGLVPRVLSLWRWEDGVDAQGRPRWITPLPWIYRNLFENLSSDLRIGSFAFALANLALYGCLAAWLHRRRIYLRV